MLRDHWYYSESTKKLVLYIDFVHFRCVINLVVTTFFAPHFIQTYYNDIGHMIVWLNRLITLYPAMCTICARDNSGGKNPTEIQIHYIHFTAGSNEPPMKAFICVNPKYCTL